MDVHVSHLLRLFDRRVIGTTFECIVSKLYMFLFPVAYPKAWISKKGDLCISKYSYRYRDGTSIDSGDLLIVLDVLEPARDLEIKEIFDDPIRFSDARGESYGEYSVLDVIASSEIGRHMHVWVWCLAGNKPRLFWSGELSGIETPGG